MELIINTQLTNKTYKLYQGEKIPFNLHFYFFAKMSKFYLTDLAAIDTFKSDRFVLSYNLSQEQSIFKAFINIKLGEFKTFPSLSQLFTSTVWLEREIFDMFGIRFSGNSDLRRLLTDGFQGHPFRVDFPLTGFSEIYFSPVQKKIDFKNLSLTQEFRNNKFLTNNVWLNLILANILINLNANGIQKFN